MAVTDDYDFDFNREDDHVWGTVQLTYGFLLTVVSDEPCSPREWTIEEVEFDAGRSVDQALSPSRRGVKIPYESPLGKALAGAWDRYVAGEQNLPYAAGAR